MRVGVGGLALAAACPSELGLGLPTGPQAASPGEGSACGVRSAGPLESGPSARTYAFKKLPLPQGLRKVVSGFHTLHPENKTPEYQSLTCILI